MGLSSSEDRRPHDRSWSRFDTVPRNSYFKTTERKQFAVYSLWSDNHKVIHFGITEHPTRDCVLVAMGYSEPELHVGLQLVV